MRFPFQGLLDRPLTIVVASTGRRAFVRPAAWRFADKELDPGCVYKTYDYPDALAERTVDHALFVFGKPTNTAFGKLGACLKALPNCFATCNFAGNPRG